MKRVIVLSPFRGADDFEREANILYAKRCMMDSLRRREAPFLSHLLYTQVLHDDNPAERTLGFQGEAAWLAVADLAAIYTDRGISPGMQMTVNEILKLPTPLTIEYRSLEFKI